MAHVLQGHDAALTPMTISPSQEFSDSAGELEGRPVVLVVEDEVLVRIVQVDILREAGFRVSEAQVADEAFEMLRSRSEILAVLKSKAGRRSVCSPSQERRSLRRATFQKV